MGNLQGTQEHDAIARATASVGRRGDEKKRPGLELGAGVGDRRGRHCGCIPHPQEASLPWNRPSLTLTL